MARRSESAPVGSWSGSHWSRTSERLTADFHSASSANQAATNVDGTACSSSESKKSLLRRIAKTTSCPCERPQLLRYIIHRKFGLIQLMRLYLKSPPKCPCSAAYRPMLGE